LSFIFTNAALAFECTNAGAGATAPMRQLTPALEARAADHWFDEEFKQIHLTTGSFKAENGLLEKADQLQSEEEGASRAQRVAGAILNFLVPSAWAATEGSSNNFFGTDAGANNVGDNDNSFFGGNAGNQNTTGTNNSFFGLSAGESNTTGTNNSFFGLSAGESNTEGFGNSFFGKSAGLLNTTGGTNSFFGAFAGQNHTEGLDNSFFGSSAGFFNTTGFDNAFFGESAGTSNTTGADNAIFGSAAGLSNTTEDNNTFIGSVSNGATGITNATALGYRAQVEQSSAMVLGSIPGINFGSTYVDVGIGTSMPQAPLHVERADGAARVLVMETQPGPSMPFQGVAQGLVRFELNDEAAGERWRFTNAGDKFAINNVGGDSPGTEMSVFKNGDLVIGGLLTENSDRGAKQDIVPLVAQDILAKIVDLEVAEWSYIDAPNQRHIGPMAQDFHTAFGLGRDNKHIATLDTSGVALVGIKALAKENQRLAEENNRQAEQNQDLRKRLEDLENLVKGLIQRQ
jgi:hypothetical protein